MLNIYETRKSNLLLMIKYSDNRKSFAEKINIEYNLLNQYLASKNPKNIGSKLALKITDAHNLQEGWLDHLHDEQTIKIIMQSNNTTHTDAINQKNIKNSISDTSENQKNLHKIIPLNLILNMTKGQQVEVTKSTEQIKNIYAPVDTQNPISYVIKGLGFSKPYRNGYVLVCEFTGKPIPGEETLIFTKDGKVYAGEYLFEDDILISIESVTGENDRILKENIARISPIKAFISPSQVK